MSFHSISGLLPLVGYYESMLSQPEDLLDFVHENIYTAPFMDTLKSFYVKTMLTVAVFVATSAHLVADYAIPWIQLHHPQLYGLLNVAHYTTSRPAVVGILVIIEWIVRNYAWRFWHPALDFSGRWVGQTTYSDVWIENGVVPVETEQEVIITQTCLKLQLHPSEGTDFVFHSLSIDIQEGGSQLVYAYHVEYINGPIHRRGERYGVECLTVVATPDKKRPRQLKGWFGQCARREEPIYSGNVVLSRV